MEKLQYLNLGCGQRYHEEWTNIDFVSTSPSVVAHDLQQGLPFPDNSFDVVYHSHVLEHFSMEDGRKLTSECARVLKPGGIIRIALPNLEDIVKTYLHELQNALRGAKKSEANYDWMLLEMFDQVVRHESGGRMAQFLLQPTIPNEEFVEGRIGTDIIQQVRDSWTRSPPSLWQLPLRTLKTWLRNNKHVGYYLIGRYRCRGDIHFQMYDRFSLKRLLLDCGFKDARVMTAFKSRIPEWDRFGLDVKDGVVHAPLSLFMEARKREARLS